MRLGKTSKARLLVCVTAAVCSSSCANDDPLRGWTGSVQDSAGIRIVQNPEEAIWCPGEEWAFTDGMIIGADVGDPTYEFGKITGIEVGSDGLVYVFDQMASEIRVFDQEGSHVRTFGGRGQGPGELSAGAAGIFLMNDDHLAIPDLNNQRISSMGLDGDFLGSAMASYAAGFPVRWDGDGVGGIFVQRRAMSFNEDPDLEAGDPLVRIAGDGSEETLVILPKAETVWMEGNAPRFRYFATEPSWDMGPSGTLRTAMTQIYRIELRRTDGQVHTILTKPSPPRPVTDGDRDRFIELMRDALTRMELSPSSVDRQIDRLSFGTTFPAFNQVMEGPEGTTLVQRIDELTEMEALDLSEEMSKRLGSRTWDVFDTEGRFLGAIELPPRFTPMVWQTTAVYGRWLDDVDRSHLRKLNLTGVDRRPEGQCR
jgi:hypothetical protein